MKFLSRDFTRTESILLILLGLILVGLFYYRFVDVPVRETIISSNADADMYQSQIDVIQQQVLKLQDIKKSMDELEAAGDLSYMASYNNSKAEITFLNDILKDTLQYSISFGEVSRAGNQIRRNFTLQYQTKGYNAAQNILMKLCDGEYRCLIGDVRCTIDNQNIVTMNQTATFYETMVGGTADAGLPQDGASVKQ